MGFIGTMLSKKKLKSIIFLLGSWAFLNFLQDGILEFLRERKLEKEEEESHLKEIQVEEKRRSKSTVVLFTYYRSGSTFTGELFNQHKDVFYLFEPLILAGIETGAENIKKELLERIFDCDLPQFHEYSSSNLPSYVKDSCGRKNYCFAHATKEFCSPPFCGGDFTTDRKMCSRGPCKVFAKNSDLIHEANRICESKHVKAIKTIRITSISPFVEFFNEFDSSQNFKFVLLIRDPRGMLNSRLRISRIQKHEKDKGAEITQKVIGQCERIVENIKTITNSHFMHSRTIILRYEDVALDPKSYAKKIYEKFNLDYSENIDNWITKNTHIDQKSGKMNFYDTRRESAKIAFDWRNPRSNRKMPYEFLQPLQEGCAEMMSLTGYRSFASEDEMFSENLQPLVPNKEVDFLLHL